MPRQVIVKPLEQIDVTRMIGNASRHLYEKGRTAGANENSYGLGYYYRMASLKPRKDKCVICHKCRSFILLGNRLPGRPVGENHTMSCALSS